MIRGNNLTLGDKKFIDDGFVFITEEKAHELRNCEAFPDDLVFTAAGTLGQVGLIPKCGKFRRYIISNKQLRLRCNTEIADPTFLYYWFAAPDMREYIANQNTGASIPLITLGTLRHLEVWLPPVPIQRRIASVLSAYDDLMENNTRRIKILDVMAQAIYREWFVHYRLPGHAKVKLVDSPIGKIPQGWQAVRFSELLVSGLGGDWGVDEPNDEENAPVLIIRGTDFDDIVEGAMLRTPKRFITPSSQARRQLRAGDLLVENSINAKSRCVGTTLLITDGVLGRLSEPAIAASFCKVYRFKDRSLAPLAHLHMRNLYAEGRMAFYQNVAANGIGNFQSQRFLESEHLTFPSDSQRWPEMFEFLQYLTSSTLADQIFNLRRTRDYLLPKLISGEVDVSDLDIKTADEAV